MGVFVVFRNCRRGKTRTKKLWGGWGGQHVKGCCSGGPKGKPETKVSLHTKKVGPGWGKQKKASCEINDYHTRTMTDRNKNPGQKGNAICGKLEGSIRYPTRNPVVLVSLRNRLSKVGGL